MYLCPRGLHCGWDFQFSNEVRHRKVADRYMHRRTAGQELEDLPATRQKFLLLLFQLDER